MTYLEEIYTVRELETGLFRIGNSRVFMDLIVGAHHALLFDTGYGFGDLKALVRSLTDKPLYVVNSHGHVDHACGNAQFGGAWIHPADMALAQEHNGRQMRMAELETAEVPMDFDLEAYLHLGTGELTPVGEGHIFDLGGLTLEVINLPGHTAGSIGLWCPEKRLLWVGDAMNCFIWLFLPEAQSLSTYISTLQKAAKLPFTHMLQSHEPDPVPKRKLWDYLDLAEHPDFENGTLVPAPLGYEGETRICTRRGIHYDDRQHPGFAAIMISREKYDG
ncbi:MAG: MBL fold metallo-hydrolase [Oscillospiraceae bacterium]|nr:MBL fold metallo-hydrolase [Oscillospiraceae bacterium]